ncbi:MAG: lipoate--protein ligase [Candidatus Bathyarchaeia archaeon]
MTREAAEWRLLDAGAVDGYVMTNLYEAVGQAVSQGASPNTLILNHPSKPFVNVGYHQQVENEINLDYVRSMGFDLVRRSIGGGAILDGPWEQDYFIIVNKRSPECPSDTLGFYAKFLKPVVHALRRLGLDAAVREPNDILVGGRKVSGNGAVSIEEANVLAGDILLECPVALMTQILKVPSEKFRDKLAKSMAEWLTSLNQALGYTPPREQVKRLLVEAFQEELGTSLEAGSVTALERSHLTSLLKERKTDAWTFMKDLDHERLYAQASRGVKVKEGIMICEAAYKAGKLVRVTMEVVDEKISEVAISGDFFTQPYIGAISMLEKGLVGTPVEEEALKSRIREVSDRIGLRVLGVTQQDLVQAILEAKASAVRA